MWHHTFPMAKHSFLWLAVRETRITETKPIVYRYQPDVQMLTAQRFSPGGSGGVLLGFVDALVVRLPRIFIRVPQFNRFYEGLRAAHRRGTGPATR